VNTNALRNPETNAHTTASGVRKRFAQITVGILIQVAILVLASGRLDWLAAWIYVSVYLAVVVINGTLLLRKNPELAAERAEMKQDAKGWDKWLATFASVVFPIVTLVVSGLDARNRWTADPTIGIYILGFILLVSGYALASWAMLSNTFFSGLVRIQKDRGHVVVTAGPYRFVRHPGYVGMIAFNLGTPLLLGSLWALIPAGITVFLFVLRTWLEDKTLQRELTGYAEYTRQVPHRLLPGLW
jgi:protein-S-isoprenylcysteine O-methyltransferase Ste14